jgi:hypothetical protein
VLLGCDHDLILCLLEAQQSQGLTVPSSAAGTLAST